MQSQKMKRSCHSTRPLNMGKETSQLLCSQGKLLFEETLKQHTYSEQPRPNSVVNLPIIGSSTRDLSPSYSRPTNGPTYCGSPIYNNISRLLSSIRNEHAVRSRRLKLYSTTLYRGSEKNTASAFPETRLHNENESDIHSQHSGTDDVSEGKLDDRLVSHGLADASKTLKEVEETRCWVDDATVSSTSSYSLAKSEAQSGDNLPYTDEQCPQSLILEKLENKVQLEKGCDPEVTGTIHLQQSNEQQTAKTDRYQMADTESQVSRLGHEVSNDDRLVAQNKLVLNLADLQKDPYKTVTLPDYICPSSERKSRQAAVKQWLYSAHFPAAMRSSCPATLTNRLMHKNNKFPKQTL